MVAGGRDSAAATPPASARTGRPASGSNRSARWLARWPPPRTQFEHRRLGVAVLGGRAGRRRTRPLRRTPPAGRSAATSRPARRRTGARPARPVISLSSRRGRCALGHPLDVPRLADVHGFVVDHADQPDGGGHRRVPVVVDHPPQFLGGQAVQVALGGRRAPRRGSRPAGRPTPGPGHLARRLIP